MRKELIRRKFLVSIENFSKGINDNFGEAQFIFTF